jgi:hypothetical protein
MAQEHGLKLDMLRQCASRWGCIGKGIEQHRPNMKEKRRFDVAYSGHAIALTARLALYLVAPLQSQIETSMWKYDIDITHETPANWQIASQHGS